MSERIEETLSQRDPGDEQPEATPETPTAPAQDAATAPELTPGQATADVVGDILGI